MNIKLFLFAFVLLLFSGCSGEEMENGGHAAGLKDVKVNLTFAISDGDSLVTRSIAFMPEGKKSVASDTVSVLTKASSVDENLISTLWVGQYDLSGNLLVSQYLTNITGNQVNFQLKESSECSLRFVANAGDLGKISTLADFNVKKVTYAAGNTCPMFGFLDKQYVSVSYSPTVPMERMLAHIQLVYKIEPGFSFTVKSVSIKSIPVQMQCVEPAGQISGMNYQDISGTVSQSGTTVDWFIPENKAGVIKNGEAGYATTDRGKCGGATVPNATYIELLGDATVNGTSYKDVSFRLYPGNGINDYNLKRNTPYVVNLTLSGIDFSDPRVSVTTPDIVAPTEIEAAINSTTTMQATARPGTDWAITLPAWLSALVDGKTTNASGTMSYTGPTPVTFTAVTANPSSTERSQSFTIAGKGVTIKQKGSVLSATSKNKTIAPEGIPHSDTEYSFSATQGLSWALAEAIDWLTLTGTTTGVVSSATTTPTVSYTVTVNPNASARTGYIFVKAGDAISGTDAALEKQIAAITQEPSIITVPSNGGTIPAAGGSITVSGITATEGLQWTITKKSGFTDFSFSGIDIANRKFVVTAKQSALVARTAVFTISVTGAEPARTFDVTITQPKNGNNYVPGTTSMMVSKAQRGRNWYYGKGTSAPDYCNNLSDLGYSDWRLPSRAELAAIYYGKNEIGNVSLTGKFWGDGGHNGKPPYAPYVNMDNGAGISSGNNSWDDNSNNVLCVRGTY